MEKNREEIHLWNLAVLCTYDPRAKCRRPATASPTTAGKRRRQLDPVLQGPQRINLRQVPRAPAKWNHNHRPLQGPESIRRRTRHHRSATPSSQNQDPQRPHLSRQDRRPPRSGRSSGKHLRRHLPRQRRHRLIPGPTHQLTTSRSQSQFLHNKVCHSERSEEPPYFVRSATNLSGDWNASSTISFGLRFESVDDAIKQAGLHIASTDARVLRTI